MKNILIPILFVSTYCFSQNVELVDQVSKTAYENKSYIYTKGVTLQAPPANGSLVISAQLTGPFFIRPAQALNGPTNIPPSMDQNFSGTEHILVRDVTSESQITGLPPDQKLVVYSYFDELGRPSQNVLQSTSSKGYDVVTYNNYNSITGRVDNQFLPYASSSDKSGGFKPNAATDLSNFYGSSSSIVSDSRPFSELVYEASPLNRVVKTYSPGSDWKDNDHGVSSVTKIVTTASIFFWNYNDEIVPPNLVTYNNSSGYYPVGTVTFTEQTDEKGHIVRNYSDMAGRNILNEVQNIDGSWNQTYLIYDNQGRVRIVLPPEACANITQYTSSTTDVQRQSFLDQWAYQYVYDTYGRVIKKKVPAAAWQLFVYDKWDRLVLTKDALSANNWIFTKYDRFNRGILSGIYTTSTSHDVLQTTAMGMADVNRFETSVSNAVGYTLNNSFPTSGITENEINIISYYDNYDFITSSWAPVTFDFSYVNVAGYPQSSEKLNAVKGLQTGLKYKILEDNSWMHSVTYYHDNYLPAQTIAQSYVGGVIQTTNQHDFVGRLQKSHQLNTFASISQEYFYTYDKAGRVLKVDHSLNGATPLTLVSNKYDEAGQLIEKNIHSTDGTNYLQSIDYKYNIRGWLTQINNSALNADAGDSQPDLLGMELQYNPTSVASISGTSPFTTKKMYDGNISAIKWKINTLEAGITPVEKIYGFDYDVLSRLKHGYYAVNSSGAWSGEANMFDEEITGYDRQGNINGLKRNSGVTNTSGAKSSTLIDDLSYIYILAGKKTDRLISVDDNSNNALGFKPAAANITEEYKYDANGNLQYDNNKGISSIAYNYLNLPTTIEFTRTPGGQIDRIRYLYDAFGNVVKKTVEVNQTQVWMTTYAGSFQYDNGTLSFFGIPEGRIIKNTSGYDYEYFLKDHLGNTRVAFGSLKETVNYRATIEPGLANSEENVQGFKNIASTRPSIATVNYTKACEKTPTPDRSAQCNAYTGNAIGPALSIRVLQGDAVYMEAFAQYNQVSGSSNKVLSSALITALTGASSFNIPNAGETAQLWSGFNTNAPAVAAGMPTSTVVPRGYLAYLFFDDSYNFVRSAAVGITDQAYNKFEKLSRSFTATTNGHLYIYVANESSVSSSVNVFFDELSIVHQKNTSSLQVTQASDYYPFGLSFNQYQSDRLYTTTTDAAHPENNVYSTTLRNRYLFQGQEAQKDLDLNWYQFEARMYDPALSRWSSADPLADKFYGASTYNFVLGNPISLADPDGREPLGGVGLQNYIQNLQYQANQRWLGYGNAIASIQNELNAPVNREWQERMDHMQGDYKPYKSYGEQYRDGEHGAFLQAMYHAGSLIPLATIPKGILEAREGNYTEAAVDIGIGISEFATLVKGISAMREVPHIAGGDLNYKEIAAIQKVVNEVERPLEIGGSAAKGTRRGVNTTDPVGKGYGTRSDIDYLVSPNYIPDFKPYQTQLPGIDPKSGLIPGYGNTYMGPFIRFEPNAPPTFVPYTPYGQ
jgi:RHS repeat-associated protein